MSDDYEIRVPPMRGSCQQLWNLLQGAVVLPTEEVILQELRDSVDRTMAALTYYVGYEETENEKKVVFPIASKVFRILSCDMPTKNEAQADKKIPAISTAGAEATATSTTAATATPTTTAGGTNEESNSNKRKAEEEESSFSLLQRAVAQDLKLEPNLAAELLVSYMMLEYKGSVTSYDQIADTQFSYWNFYRDLCKYYKRERMCLLLYIQTILSIIGNQDHHLFDIVERFRSIVSFKKWCWGLLRSFVVSKDDDETLEILNCLSLLMHKAPEETIPEFFTYFTKIGFVNIRRTEEMKIAEGAAMYSALVVSGITDCCNGVFPVEFGARVSEFIKSNFETLMRNPYNLGPVFAAYDMFGKDDRELTTKMRCVNTPNTTFSNMLKLIDFYGKDTLNDRNEISFVVSMGMFEAFESLLANYDAKHFGSNIEGFQIFAKLLQHTTIAESFLCGTPLALTALYADATTLFPLDIPSTLQIWKSLCMSLRRADLCETLVKGVSKMNAVAEFMDDEYGYYMKRIDENRLKNRRTRSIFGIELQAGAMGIINTVKGNMCVVWELPASMHISALEVLRWNIQPIAEVLLRMRDNSVSPYDYQRFDYGSHDLHAISQFITQFWKSTSERVVELSNLVQPVCIIMEIMLEYKVAESDKARLLPDLLGIVAAVARYHDDFQLVHYIYKFLPGAENVSMVQELILGHEGVTATCANITIAYLDLLCCLTENPKCWQQGHFSDFEVNFLHWITFVAEYIIGRSHEWKFESDGTKNEIHAKCLRIFIEVYSLKGNEWNSIKQECARYLITRRSCLVTALQIDENSLQDSIIRPTENNKMLGVVANNALKLLHRMVQSDNEVLNVIDLVLDGWLVRTLGRFVRHRLIPSIPTLATWLLKIIGETTTFSLFACFGDDEASFRDVVIQRLEFTTEDLNLKIAVLDYLTVVTQTQFGIIQYFFSDGSLESSIIDLMGEEDELTVSCLFYLRSMFRQRQQISKSRDDFWRNLFYPVDTVTVASPPEIISASFHIITFELYRNGTNDSNFTKELQTFLKGGRFKEVVQIAASSNSEGHVKSLVAIKHLITLIIGRSEYSKLISQEILTHLQSQILKRLWSANPDTERDLCASLAELAVVVATPETIGASLLKDLVTNLVETFPHYHHAAQLSLLCLVNKCFFHCEEPIWSGDVENTCRILKRIFHVAVKLIDKNEDLTIINQLLTVSATIIETITVKHHGDLWGLPMRNEYIPASLVLVASTAISRQKADNVVGNVLSALICFADNQFGCDMVPVGDVTRGLNANLHKYMEEGTDESSKNVFFTCLHLNTSLLASLKHLYLDEMIVFWGQYNKYLHLQLSKMTELMEASVQPDDSDKSYENMKRLLTCGYFVLNNILMMSPFIEKWHSIQPEDVFKAIRGVFYTLQEIGTILGQPFLFQSALAKSKMASFETKMPKRLSEIHSRLWEICDICLQILCKIQPHCEEFIEKATLLPTIVQMAYLCIRVLNKGSEKRTQTSLGTTTSRISSILEKCVVIVFKFALPVLNDPNLSDNELIAFRRDMRTDVSNLCEAVRRLLTPPRDNFLSSICVKMEAKIK